MAYRFGEEFEYDELRANTNISSLCKGLTKRKLRFKPKVQGNKYLRHSINYITK